MESRTKLVSGTGFAEVVPSSKFLFEQESKPSGAIPPLVFVPFSRFFKNKKHKKKGSRGYHQAMQAQPRQRTGAAEVAADAPQARLRATGGHDRGLREVNQETERLLLLLEGQVFPELMPSPALGAAKKDVEASVDQTVNQIRLALREVESLIPTERDPLKREVQRKKLESNTSRLVDLERMGTAQRKALKTKADRGLLFDPEAPAQGLAAYAQEAESLQKSRRNVSDIIGVGAAVLESLGSQSDTIRKVAGKVDGVAGSLGLSNSLMRAVRRRQFGDAALVYGGMIVVTLILVLFYRWTHSQPNAAGSVGGGGVSTPVAEI